MYDLDNLVYPVVAVSGCAHCASIWARVEVGTEEGVLIRDQAPPDPPANTEAFSRYIERPSNSSVRDRPPIPELVGVATFGGDELLGMALQFDSAGVALGELGYEGPVKSLIDDMTPLFGLRLISGRLLAKDDRVKELRITRGHNPGRSGVTVMLWYL